MIEAGVSQVETARTLSIPRWTVRTWVAHGFATAKSQPDPACDPCEYIEAAQENPSYAYLLGLYLGDGYIASYPRQVYRLRITLDQRYPNIIRECRVAMERVHPSLVGTVWREGCVEVNSYWKHWPCLFPQHGVGPKHLRPIILERWQRMTVLERFPQLLLRGLIHSDGCRVTNTVKKQYRYPRYHFTNYSSDIHAIFTEACQAVGISCRYNNRVTQSIARRSDVERLDSFVGPKS